MKLKLHILFVALLEATVLSVVAQPVFLGGPANPVTNTVAYPPGWSLIANPLFHNRGEYVSNSVPDNTVAELFAIVPDGTMLLKFDNSTQHFTPRNLLRHGRWSKPDQTLIPGEGAWLFNPGRKPLEIEFTGNVPYGSVSLPSGMSLISSPGPGTIDFTVSKSRVTPPGPFVPSGIQFNPQEGDVVYIFVRRKHGVVQHHFHNGSWDTLPTAAIGESFFVLTSHPRSIQYAGPLPLSPQ